MSRRLTALAATAALLALTPTFQPAHAAEVEGHAPQHFEVGLGVGVLSGGLGAVAGYRAPFGLRAEAGLGTFGFANGLSAGAGYSLRLHDGSYFTLEAPLMAYGLVFSENDLGYDDCEYDCGDHSDTGVGYAAGSGLDFIFGAARTNGDRFVLGVRGGVLGGLKGVVGSDGGLFPMAQLNFGVTL